MSKPITIIDPSQRDLSWVGYAPRAMAPAIALTAGASLLVWTGRWYLEELSEFTDRVGALALFALAWAVWPALVAVFLYRTTTFTYRLTDRALLVDYGFLSPPVSAMPLSEINSVTIGGGWLARRLGVGWIEVRTKDRAVRLRGVHRPDVFALAIREAVEKARSGT